MNALFIMFCVTFLVPKFEKLLHDGMIHQGVLDDSESLWMITFVRWVSYIAGHYTLLLLLVPAAAWGLFEWRVESENKSFIRLSALGTAALTLTIIAGLLTGFMLIVFMLGMPAFGRIAKPFALEQVAKIDTATTALEQKLAKKDWPGAQEEADRTKEAIERLAHGPALASLRTPDELASLNELRASLRSARENLRELGQAVAAKDAVRAEAELARFRKTLEPVREAARKAGR
ncbi:MAG: hypothetical protein HYR84_03355 [Planctomycetes bacterium]|nr:hypothetical protein [Planctomycetota bacterium]